MQALNIQNNLNSATDAMNKSMKRMSTGFKINQASDDAAGMAVSTSLETQISGTKQATQNAQIGSNLLSTSEGTLGTIQTNVSRIRDLIEQAANGTSSQSAKTAARTEIVQRLNEINRQAKGSNFNGTDLFNSAAGKAGTNGIALQVGSGSSDITNVIQLDKSLFKDATASSLGAGLSITTTNSAGNLTTTGGFTAAAINLVFGADDGTGAASTTATMATAVTNLLNMADNALADISNRKTNIGAYQNRLTSAEASLTVSQTNLSAANSTIKDADVAEESANYVKNQILQSASTSLLTQANSQPQIALQLIKG